MSNILNRLVHGRTLIGVSLQGTKFNDKHVGDLQGYFLNSLFLRS
jgi:hypothetical protein